MNTSRKPSVISDYAMEFIHHKAREVVGMPGFEGLDVEDIEQELTLDLLERLPKFNPAKATNSTFVQRLVERKISNMIRDNTREQRDPEREECSLNDDTVGEDGEIVPLGETIPEDGHDFRLGRKTRLAVDRDDLALDTAAALAELPEELRAVAEALSTMTVAEASRKLGIPRWKFYGVYLPQLRAVFDAKGLREYLQ